MSSKQDMYFYFSKLQRSQRRCDSGAKTRPILPKHTQQQNKTLAIHVATLICSFRTQSVTRKDPDCAPPAGGDGGMLELPEEKDDVGAGMRPGLMASKAAVPRNPIAVLRVRPAVVRSRRYQRMGLARASVRDSCRVVSQGRRRCARLGTNVL
jgi:hypothetical protein